MNNLPAALKAIERWGAKYGSMARVGNLQLIEVLTALCSEPELPYSECDDPDCGCHGVAKPATTVADKGTIVQSGSTVLFEKHAEHLTASAVDDTAKSPSGLKEGADKSTNPGHTDRLTPDEFKELVVNCAVCLRDNFSLVLCIC